MSWKVSQDSHFVLTKRLQLFPIFFWLRSETFFFGFLTTQRDKRALFVEPLVKFHYPGAVTFGSCQSPQILQRGAFCFDTFFRSESFSFYLWWINLPDRMLNVLIKLNPVRWKQWLRMRHSNVSHSMFQLQTDFFTEVSSRKSFESMFFSNLVSCQIRQQRSFLYKWWHDCLFWNWALCTYVFLYYK